MPVAFRSLSRESRARSHSNSMSNYSSRSEPNINCPRTKSAWRPTLEYMYDDDELLKALITFMEHHTMEENILFLQSVHGLNDQMRNNELCIDTKQMESQQINHHEIDSEICSIYRRFIADDADTPINLPSDVLKELKRTLDDEVKVDELSWSAKRTIFDDAIHEIERLMVCRVLMPRVHRVHYSTSKVVGSSFSVLFVPSFSVH